jgi:hypothetical protein
MTKRELEMKGAVVSEEKCPNCKDTEWVCENHPDQPFQECEHCDGAGMQCECVKKENKAMEFLVLVRDSEGKEIKGENEKTTL